MTETVQLPTIILPVEGLTGEVDELERTAGRYDCQLDRCPDPGITIISGKLLETVPEFAGVSVAQLVGSPIMSRLVTETSGVPLSGICLDEIVATGKPGGHSNRNIVAGVLDVSPPAGSPAILSIRAIVRKVLGMEPEEADEVKPTPQSYLIKLAGYRYTGDLKRLPLAPYQRAVGRRYSDGAKIRMIPMGFGELTVVERPYKKPTKQD